VGWSAGRARGAVGRDAVVSDAPSDAALVVAACGDRGAFIALYERYVGRIYAYCLARLGDREAAEDATSKVFIKALAALGRYEDVLFADWIFRIAHNVVVDARRRRLVGPLPATDERPDPTRGPDEALCARAEGAAVQAALCALAADERAVIELPYAGWSGEEIAARLGRSPEAVKQLRYRAMGRLRALLTRSGYGPGGQTPPRRLRAATLP